MKKGVKSMSSIEKVISEAIKKRGLMQKFVSQHTGISETNLSLALRGKRALKSTELVSLCLFLGLSLGDFEGCQIG